MKLKTEILRDEELLQKLRELPEHARAPLRAAIVASVLDVQTAAINSIQRGTPTGTVYRRYRGEGSYVEHQASASGEPPASDTGALASSVRWVLDEDGLTGAVGSNLVYSRALEFGWPASNLEARPWLFPAAEKNRRNVVARIAKAVRDALAKGAK